VADRATKRFLKRLALRLALRYGLRVVRGYLLEKIEGVTPSQLYQAIKEGEDILLSEHDARYGRKWARKLSRYMGYVNTKTVLAWLSHDRPDLASLIVNTPGGVRWLTRQIEHVKSQLSRSP